MFPLVPAHRGSPGQRAIKRLFYQSYLNIFGKLLNSNTSHTIRNCLTNYTIECARLNIHISGMCLQCLLHMVMVVDVQLNIILSTVRVAKRGVLQLTPLNDSSNNQHTTSLPSYLQHASNNILLPSRTSITYLLLVTHAHKTQRSCPN